MKMLRNRSLTNTLSLLFFLGISLPQVASESEPVTIDYTQCKSVIKMWKSIGGWVKPGAGDFCCTIENSGSGELVSGLPGVVCGYEESPDRKSLLITVLQIDWSYKPGSKHLTGNLTGKLPSEIGNLVNLGELNLSGNPGLCQVLYPACDTEVYYEGTNITVDRTRNPCKSTSTESSSTSTESISTSTESSSTNAASTSTQSSSTTEIVDQTTTSTIEQSQTSDVHETMSAAFMSYDATATDSATAAMSTDCDTTDSATPALISTDCDTKYTDDLVAGSTSKVSLSLSALVGLAFFMI